jgi:hypothetical protein
VHLCSDCSGKWPGEVMLCGHNCFSLKNPSIWGVEVNPTSSWILISILSVRELAHGCIRHQIGDGKASVP